MDPLQQVANSMRADGRSRSAKKAPKYLRLYELLLGAIEQGLWKPGEQVPAEAVLAERIPVSLGTIQKALRMLVDAGVLTRRHGRGTYVAGALTSPGKIRNFRFLADDGVSLLPVYSRLLSMKRITASKQWAQFFPRETKLVFISRLFSVNLEFQSYAEAYLPEKRFGKLLDIPARELDGSALTHMLQERFNAPALNVTHRLTQRILPEDACRHIAVEIGTLGMVWEIIGRSFREEVIFYQRFYMPPTTRTIEINPFTQIDKEGS